MKVEAISTIPIHIFSKPNVSAIMSPYFESRKPVMTIITVTKIKPMRWSDKVFIL